MAADADKAVAEIGQVNRRATNMEKDIQDMLKKIQGEEKFCCVCWYLPELRHLQNI